MSAELQSDLPPGWTLTTLGAIRLDRSQNIEPSRWPDEQFELYSVPSYDIGTPDIVYGSEIGSNKQIVEINTVLLCKINPRINRVWMVGSFSPHRKIASTEWIPFESISGIDPRYLRYFMQQGSFRDFLAANVAGIGGSLMRIKPSVFENFPLPLPPISEQHRIVEEIEKQFSRLDAGVAGLNRTEGNLKRLRAVTLRAATEGRLVQNEAALARLERRDYESGAQLLERVVSERRSKWEAAQLAKMDAQGKQPKNEKWKAKYVQPASPDISNLPDLPEGWTWATLDQLSWDASYGTSEKTKYEWSGTPVIRIPNISNGRIDTHELKRAKQSLPINGQTALTVGDLLIVRTNGSKDLIGRGALVRIPFEELYYFASYLIRFRLPSERTLQEWIALQWDSIRVRKFIEDMAATTAGQYNVRLSSLKDICIPLPPTAEQERIISEFERRQSIADNLEKAVSTNLERAEVLRQRILKHAFEGKLVSQGSSDESAEKLLEKILSEKLRLERVRAPKINQPKRRRIATQKEEKQFSLPFKTSSSKRPIAQESSRKRDMKLISLKIDGEYKSLHNFEQVFRRGSREDSILSPICLVGLNGSGKSNLIESLSEIFCYLEIINLPYEKIRQKYRQTPLRFEMEYELPSKGSKSMRRIRISKVDDSLPVFTEINEDDDTENEIDEASQFEALPTRIVGYSSGMNETISIPFFRNKSVYAKEVGERAFTERELSKKKLALPAVVNTRSFFMDYDSNAAILLANYLFPSKTKLDVFSRYLRINDIASFQITVQLIYGSNRPVELTSELKDAIASLQKCATEAASEDGGNRLTFTYKVNQQTRKAFREEFGNAKNLFSVLYKLSLLNYLALTGSERRLYWREDVKEGLVERPPIVPKEQKIFNIDQLRLKLSEPKIEIDYAGISDGEHQFINVFGTIQLFDEPGCMFLLDEPETHFNPVWRREFVQILEDIPSTLNQEFVISTHSPFIVSGCHRENVFKFERDGDSIKCARVDFETFGSSFDYLLMKLFDLETLISEQAYDELKDVIQSNSLSKLESAVSQFGESFEKRFLFEKIAKVKNKRK